MKQKIPFQIFFLESLAVVIDKWTACLYNLEVSNVTEKENERLLRFYTYEVKT